MPSLSVRALLCVVTAAALAGCMSAREAQSRQDAAAAKVALAELKNSQDAQAVETVRLAGDVKAMDAQQAFLVTELKSLSEQFAKLRSSVSEAEAAIRSLRATPAPSDPRPVIPLIAAPPATALTPAPTPIPAAVPAPEPPQSTLEQPQMPAVAAATPPVEVPPPASPPAVIPPTATTQAAAAPAPDAPPLRSVEADRLFAAAAAKLRAGDDGQAALEFTEFISRFPSHPQAAAAQNYIGEAYYRQGDFRQAMVEFQKTVDTYTQPAPASEALLKIGLCHRELGDTVRAKASWEEVVTRFPRSDAAHQARALLASRPAAG